LEDGAGKEARSQKPAVRFFLMVLIGLLSFGGKPPVNCPG
jgi:hypothetical protein